MIPIVLASSSPRRAALLNRIQMPFTTDPADLDEEKLTDPSLPPSLQAELLARKKAEAVAPRRPGALIVAADTMVCFQGELFGKPSSAGDAEQMLRRLSGNSHEVFTGVSVILTNPDASPLKTFTFSERTIVTFTALDNREITRYVHSGSPMDKAGAYGIQDDFGVFFVKRIEGDYNNIVGFPLHSFYRKLKTCLPQVHDEIFLPGNEL